MTSIQYVILFSLVYLYVYALICRICKCIEHCATARAYSKLRENGVMTKMSDVEAGIIKIGKEKEDARVKNKIHAVLFILLGALSVPIEWDATFFLFTLIIGGYLFFSKENWIYEGEEDDGTSREKTCSKVKAKRENHYIQSHKGTTRCHGSGKNRRRTYQSKAGGYR